MYSIVVPAYGQVIKTKKQFESVLRNGNDLRMLVKSDGTVVNAYCSIRDFKKGEKIEVRFGRHLSQVAIITI